MKTITRRLALAAAAGGLAFLLWLPLLHPAPVAMGCAQRLSCESEDLLHVDERYAASNDGVIVQIALPPRPVRPKQVGGAAALLEDSGDRAKAFRRCLRTVYLIAPNVPCGNPHAGAWCSRAPPIRAA